MRYITGIILLTLLIAASCSGGATNGTSNLNPPVPAAVFTPGGLGLFDGEPADLTVTITNGTPPYTVAINMGGGADNVPAGTAVDATSIHDFTLSEGGPYSYTVTVTDNRGETGTTAGNYGPVGPAQNHAPTITDIAFDGGILAVMVNDPDGDDPLTVSVGEVPGLVPNMLTQQVANEGAALFNYRLLDGVNAAGMSVTATVSDGKAESTRAATPSGSIPPVTVPDGALAAIPLKTRAVVGEVVTIAVVTGGFPEEAPFCGLNGMSITCDDGFSASMETLNTGTLGGEDKAIDGIWALFNPPLTKLMTPEGLMMIWPTEVDSDPSRDMVHYAIWPVPGGNITSGGVLFNCPFTFEEPGEYRLGFLEFQHVKQTYYSDLEGNEYNWADITNEIPGLPNTIIVTDQGNQLPMVESISFDGGAMSVVVSDPNAGDRVTVSLAGHNQILADTSSAIIDTAGTAVFNLAAFHVPPYAFDEIEITVSDGQLERTHTVTPPKALPVITVPEDTLVAFPLKREVAVGEAVTVMVRTGDFPAGHSFRSGFTALLTVDAEPEFVMNSYNLGSVGGDSHEADGVWGTMDPPPSSFFMPHMVWEYFRPVPESNPQLHYCPCWAFAAVCGPTDSGGDLFNLQLKFDYPGEYHLGFIATAEEHVTTYSDSSGGDPVWSDIGNDVAGFPNTITVVE